MTLVELLVVLVLLGVAASIASFSLERWDRARPPDGFVEQVAELRRAAVDSARAITRMVATEGGRRIVTALPDGSVLTDGDAFDRFTGRPVTREK